MNPIYFYDFEPSYLNDIDTDCLDMYNWKTYKFEGKPVPRMSEILSVTTDNSKLIDWAGKVGYKYKQIKQNALDIGTAVHERIENYLLYNKGIRFSNDTVDYKLAVKIENAYTGFLNWYEDMKRKGIKLRIYGIEKEITCPWFGGTTDCIIGLEKDGKENVYILDFKTSKSISINYYLQTYGYYWGIMYNKYCLGKYTEIPDIDGLAILRVDKDTKGRFEFRTIEFRNPECYTDTTNLHNAFKAMINWFYYFKRIN